MGEEKDDIYAAIQATLAAFREDYGKAMTNDECGELCNRTAYAHKDDLNERGLPIEWGLSYKAGGTNAILDDGTPVAHDILMRGDTKEGFDVLVGAGAQSTPTWGSVGRITDPSRHWVAPIKPMGGPVNPPKPPTPPAAKLKPRDQFAIEFAEVNEFYAAPEGLQRPGGMVLNGKADIVAMTQWGYDLMAGASVETVIDAIKTSDEYKQKHGG